MEKEDLNFTIYCVGILSESLQMEERQVYHLLQKGGLIMGYIVGQQENPVFSQKLVLAYRGRISRPIHPSVGNETI